MDVGENESEDSFTEGRPWLANHCSVDPSLDVHVIFLGVIAPWICLFLQIFGKF